MTTKLPSIYQEFIHTSRYARYREDLQRRETWEETVTRYIDFFKSKTDSNKKIPWKELQEAILSLQVMPSMRAMMTAGPALDKDNVAGYNCSYIAIDNPKAFDEIMYILMCFHPDTMIRTKNGSCAISTLKVGDEVSSFDEITKTFVWKRITKVVETPSAKMDKIKITLENGQEVFCTSNHKWLTENRGWVEARTLTTNDTLVSPKFIIYQIMNNLNGKKYIGYTSNSAEYRFKQHISESQVKSTTKFTSHFHRAINKYGIDCWSVSILDYAYSKEEAQEKERRWIVLENTKFDGYNSTDGGEGAYGYSWTEEQKQKVSENAYPRTKEHRDKQKEILKKAQPKINITRQTLEYKERQRIRNTGINNPRFGYMYTDEERQLKKEQAGKRSRIGGRFA